jgi:hypothetical protein
VQPSGPCSNQKSRHRPNRLANIHQYRAFVQLSTLVPPIRVQLEVRPSSHPGASPSPIAETEQTVTALLLAQGPTRYDLDNPENHGRGIGPE